MKTQYPEDKLDFIRKFAADPASSLNQTDTIRSEARLEQILVTPISATSGKPMVSTGFDRRFASNRVRTLRWVAVPVTAAAVIAAGVIWPHNPVTPAPALTAHAALATWQPVPTVLSPELLDVANTQCRLDLESSAAHLAENINSSPLSTNEIDPTIGDLIIAEQRGDWGFLAYVVQDPGETGAQITNTGSCFVWFPAARPGEAVVMTSAFNSVGEGRGAGTMGTGWNRGSTMDGWIQGPEILQTWGGWGNSLQDAAGNPLPWDHRATGLGANFADGTAFQAIFGILAGADEVVIQAGDTDVTPTITSDWFAAWWPVTLNEQRLAEMQQCRADWEELQRVNLNLAAENFCPGFGLEFTPGVDAITFAMPDGAASTYESGADRQQELAVAAALVAARAARAEAEKAAAERGEELVPPPTFESGSDFVMVRNDISQTGIELPWLFLAGETITLPTETQHGWPIAWSIRENPNGASITDGVLAVGEVSLSGGSYEALGLTATIDVAGELVPLRFSIHVVYEPTLIENARDRGNAFITIPVSDLGRLTAALAAAAGEEGGE